MTDKKLMFYNIKNESIESVAKKVKLMVKETNIEPIFILGEEQKVVTIKELEEMKK